MLAAHVATSAVARDITFPVSNGGAVTVAPLDEIDTCQEAERAQRTIDQSRYRSGSPASVTDPRDRELLRYEERLAVLVYDLCPNERESPERYEGRGLIRPRG